MHGTLKVNSCRLILYKSRLQCTTCFLQCSFFFYSACWSCRFLSQGWVHSLPLSYALCMWAKDTQYNLLGGWHFFSGFFVSPCLVALFGGINRCGWYLAEGRGCWLKGLYQISSVNWIFHHSLHMYIHKIYSFLSRIS